MKQELLLELRDATVDYGGIRALEGVNIRIDEGEIVALMGPNGAGKSTVLKALLGIAPLSKGGVYLHGQELTPRAHEMVARGIAYVPQGRQVFKSLTVFENLELGGYVLPNRADVRGAIEEVFSIFPILKEKRHERAGLLSGGQQQMLTIARALISDPRVLLLDEPSLGLSPKIVKEVFTLIQEIHRLRSIAVVIVEHSIASVLSVAERAYVLAYGKVVLEKSAEELRDGDELKRVFLRTKS